MSQRGLCFTLSTIGGHWRATYICTLAPILRIDVGTCGKRRRIREETTQARADGGLGQGVASGENLDERICR